eukprot:261536_1
MCDKKRLCIIFAAFVVFIGVYLEWLGIRMDVAVAVGENENAEIEPFPNMAYLCSKGSFYKLSSLKQEAKTIAKELMLKDNEYKVFGMFFDDPHYVKESELRSIAGLILTGTLNDVMSVKEKLKKKGFAFRSIDDKSSAFLYRWQLRPLLPTYLTFGKWIQNPFSFILGAKKFYGYVRQQNGLKNGIAALEIFTNDHKVIYIYPKNNYKDFKIKNEIWS